MACFCQCRRLAPAAEPPEEATAQDKHPQPARVATLEEIQHDLLEAEAEVRQFESRQAAELETEVEGEMRQLIAKHKHSSAGVADISATPSAMEREAHAGATPSPEGASASASHSSLASQTEAQVKHATVLATVLEASGALATAARNHPSSRAALAGDVDELESENTNTSAKSEEDPGEDVEDSEEVNRQVKGKDNGIEKISGEREKAERTVGGGASEGRKPPV